MPTAHRGKTLPGAKLLGKEYFELLFKEIPEAIVISNNTGKVIRVNGEFTRMFGYSNEEARDHQVDELIAPEEHLQEATGITLAVADGTKMAAEATRRRKDGSRIQVSILGVPIITRDKQVAVYGIYRDISDRKRAEAAAQREKAYLAQLVDTAAEGIVMLGAQGQVILQNGEFCRMFGYAPEEVAGRTIAELILPEPLRDQGSALLERMLAGDRLTVETVRRRKDGSTVDVSIIGSPIFIDGRQVAAYAIYRDISDIKTAHYRLLESQRQVMEANASLQERTRQLEEMNVQLERISNHDGLTAIPNRRYFEHFYGLEWRRARREQKWITLVMVDVDFFKAYNDRHGHLAGDDCLKKVAQALQVVNRASDLVARYGGEEFVAVLSGTDPDGARLMAERMRQRVHHLHLVHGASSVGPYVTISLGVASQVPQAEASPEDLLLHADQALYTAKSLGRDQVQVLAP